MRFLNKRAALVTSCLIVALAFVAPPLTRSDDWNLATKFTVNHPFEVPGMVLQPNTPYVIRLLDSQATRDVVQIYNEDQTKMLSMFLTIASERMEPMDKTLFTFIETEPQYPLPIKEWFYPGRLRGREFVYPKDQALQIAQHAREPILASGSTNLHDLASIEVEAIGPIRDTQTSVVQSAANVTQSETNQVFEEKPSPSVEETNPAEPAVDQENVAEQENLENSTQIAQNTNENQIEQERPSELPAVSEESTAPNNEESTAPNDNEQANELPRTAGELPLVALIGVLCLGAGLGLKVLSARS